MISLMAAQRKTYNYDWLHVQFVGGNLVKTHWYVDMLTQTRAHIIIYLSVLLKICLWLVWVLVRGTRIMPLPLCGSIKWVLVGVSYSGNILASVLVYWIGSFGKTTKSKPAKFEFNPFMTTFKTQKKRFSEYVSHQYFLLYSIWSVH